MNQEFLKPRLVGSRFNDHTLPLEILKDFSALEEMLVEVAKHQYRTAHPHRARSPKGFTKGLDLHLIALEPGSVTPVIGLVFASLFPSADAVYFEQAKDQIIETIAAAEQGRGATLPPELLRYFDRFGRGLREGESIEFPRHGGQVATLTPATRERLLRNSQAEQWTEETTLKGRIPEVDQADDSFELELRDGTKLKAPLLEPHRQTVLSASMGYRQGALVSIKGVIQRDRADRPKAFEVVEHITPLDPLDIETRLEELALLQDGWLDGRGRAPQHQSLLKLAQVFDGAYDPDLPLPYLYPTAEGGIQAEWTLMDWEVSLEIALPEFTAEFQALHMKTGFVQDFDLHLGNGKNEWDRLNEALKALNGG